MKGFGYFDGFGQLTRLTENMNDPDKLIPDEEEVDVPAPKRVSIPDGQNAAFKKITGAASEKKPEGEFDLGKGKKDQNVIFASNDLLGEECKSIMTAVEAFDWSNPDQGGLQVDEEPKEAAVDRTDEAKRDKALDTNTVKEKFK